jgi:hypothetical protein
MLGASLAAVLCSLGPPRATVLHAEEGTVCSSVSAAQAHAYDDPSVFGASSGGVFVRNYSLENCVGLAQTEAIFQAGWACQNAGIPAGLVYGVGYAVVSWSVEWSNGVVDIVTGPDQPQQYDCGDTFS